LPSDTASGPLVLGFDTSGAWCRAALLRGGTVIAACDIALARGQGERLMPALEDVLAQGGQSWGALSALGVGIGPGNFTGIRIAVAAARGLALGLAVPSIGVSRFDALALDGPELPTLVAAPRGQGWLCHPGHAPALIDPATLNDPVIADPAEFPGLKATAPVHPLAVAIARIAAQRQGRANPRPAPLYLRDADAAPPSQPPPALIDP